MPTSRPLQTGSATQGTALSVHSPAVCRLGAAVGAEDEQTLLMSPGDRHGTARTGARKQALMQKARPPRGGPAP